MPDAPILDVYKILEGAAVGWKVDKEGKLILETYINKTEGVHKAADHTGGSPEQPQPQPQPQPTSSTLEAEPLEQEPKSEPE